MNSTIKKVFLIIALLVVIFLAWQLFFNDDGILVTAYNAMATGINEQFHEATGGTTNILPLWGEADADTNGGGFNMDTEGGH